MTIALTVIAAIALAAWLWMLALRGGFWLARERDDADAPAPPAQWPAVVAVVPARNEADVVARSVGSLLAQDYAGDFRVILMDDASDDGTADVARQAARDLGREDRLQVVTGAPLPAGWTGKLWAVSQGVAKAMEGEPASGETPPKYLLLTDADIAHDEDNLSALVARAEAGNRVLVSLMAKLCVETWPERLLIPAFVFFFDMLYPFAWVNDHKNKTAAAAGGVMLARADALAAAGGIAAIRTAIIDDCALGTKMKAQGSIWLGLTDRARSLRPYQSLAEIGRMVSRSAYAQLNYSPWLLAGTLVGMLLVYVAAPVLTFAADGWPRWLGLAAWTAMAVAFQPMLAFYRRSPLWGFALPLIGALYCLFTVQSAVAVWQGKGGMWKGRAQAMAAGA